MINIIVRHSEMSDITIMSEIYNYARNEMRRNGNLVQWVNGYPSVELLESDIKKRVSYIIECDGKISGVFALIFGDDPTYAEIENGTWLNDKPYGTIHRIASNDNCPGILKIAVDYASTLIDEIRIDTHADNTIMQKLLFRYGFKKCGIIYIADGTPRTAFQKSFGGTE